MTLPEFYSILKQLDIPVAYNEFNDRVKAPFALYTLEDNDDFHADNTKYYKLANGMIDLYSVKKDIDLEKRLTDLLETNKIPYSKATEQNIKSARLFLVRYEFEINLI